MEGRQRLTFNTSRICQVSPSEVFTDQNMRCTCIGVYLQFPCLVLSLVEIRRCRSRKQGRRLPAAPPALWQRGRHSFSRAAPFGMCCLWLMLVTLTHSVLAWQLQPAQPPCWGFMGRGSFPQGCRFMGVNVGFGAPPLLRGICCLWWPLCFLQPHQDPNLLLRPHLSLCVCLLFGTVWLVFWCSGGKRGDKGFCQTMCSSRSTARENLII